MLIISIGRSKVFQTVPNHPVRGVPNWTDQKPGQFGCEKWSGTLNHPKNPIPDWYDTMPVHFTRLGLDNIAMEEGGFFSVSQKLVQNWYDTIPWYGNQYGFRYQFSDL